MRTEPRSNTLRVGVVVATALIGCLALAALAPPLVAGPGILLLSLAVVFRRRLSAPAGLLGTLVLVVMWVPAGRYSLLGAPAALPWRVVVLLLLLVVFLALALDRSIRWQRSPLMAPVLVFPAVGLLSTLVNLRSIARLDAVATGALATAQLFLLAGIFVVGRQLISSSRLADWVCRLLVLTAAGVSVSVFYERLTGLNIFINLQAFLPLQLLSAAPEVARFGTARALGSANHPIALSVVLVMLLPIAVFLARHSPWPRHPALRRGLYLGSGFAMVLAAFLTGSRTFVVMLVAMALLLLVNDWVVFVRAMLASAPFLAVAAVLLPGPVRSLLQSFLDPSRLIEGQYASAGSRGSGRLADLGPSLQEAQGHLPFGTGVGSRVISGPDTNALILDNQYLSTLLESGLLGLLAMVALLWIPVAVMLRRTRDAALRPAERDLALALGCVFASYAVAAFFFDAFAFQQTFMVFLLLLAVGSWLVATADGRGAGQQTVAVAGSTSAAASVAS